MSSMWLYIPAIFIRKSFGVEKGLGHFHFHDIQLKMVELLLPQTNPWSRFQHMLNTTKMIMASKYSHIFFCSISESILSNIFSVRSFVCLFSFRFSWHIPSKHHFEHRTYTHTHIQREQSEWQSYVHAIKISTIFSFPFVYFLSPP